MSNVTIELNSAGVRELLQSEAIRAAVMEAAAGVCARAGNGYTVEAYTTAQRAAARVKAEADAAERENRENNTLPGLSGRQYRKNGRSGIPGEAGGFVHSCGTHRRRRRIRTAGNLRHTELCRRAGGRRGAERDREEGHEPLCRGNKHFRLPAEQRLRVYGHEQKALPLSGGI